MGHSEAGIDIDMAGAHVGLDGGLADCRLHQPPRWDSGRCLRRRDNCQVEMMFTKDGLVEDQ